MYRTAASRLRALKGRTGNGTLKRFASSTAVTTQSSSGGLFSWLTGGKSSSLPTLDFPLNDVSIPPPLPDLVEPGKTRITRLPNGLRIASETSPNPVASMGLYVDCGSIYETPASYGATHLLEHMAFKSTKNRSHFRIVREVEAIGGNVTASASREQMIYAYDALKTHLPEMVELLVDSVRNPAFLDWEVNEQIEKVKEEIGELSNNPQHLILEAIHSTGYSGPYGHPLMASKSALGRLNSTVLEEFVTENYTAPRIVLAASGVEHDELLKLAEPLLSDMPKVHRSEEPKPVYVGGDYRHHADDGATNFALAFELPGGWLKEKDAMTLTVLQLLMGGGGSFSAGGPGKGMYSRLYLRVLNQYPQMQMFSAFSSIYNTTGLFGIQVTTSSIVREVSGSKAQFKRTTVVEKRGIIHYGSSPLRRVGRLMLELDYRKGDNTLHDVEVDNKTPDYATEAVDVAVKELIAVASPGQVDQVQLERAKQATKSAILMNLESRIVAAEDIGKQISAYGERKPVEHFLKLIDDVKVDDIMSVAQKLISSPLTMASHGDVLYFPTYDAVSQKFR